MCGIVGYIGKNRPEEVLLDGLKSLEYRGYDSSGVALKNNDQLQVIKSLGKISNLEEKMNHQDLIDSHIGIAHTRWATHGEPSEINAHPHQIGKVILVHNGIIENASELREGLKKEGVVFQSQTDTEVVSALINKYYDTDPVCSIEKALKEIKGSYALGIVFTDREELYAVRKDSPLVVGIGEGEYFIASDISAIVNYTKKYILLDENEIAKIDFDGYTIIKDGKCLQKEVLKTDLSSMDKDKCGYDHFMLKEIMEQPVVLRKTLAPYLEDLNRIPDLSSYEEIHVVACGSALYAGMVGKSLLEEKAGIRVSCEVASEYRYKKVFYDKKTLVILISQSGETADTIAAMRKAKASGIDTLAIVNVKTSTIARESDRQIFIEAGPEIAVATTKAYILQVAVLALLSYASCKSKQDEKSVIEEFRKLPNMVESIISRREDFLKIAEMICKKENIFFIGRKVDYAICLEGSLKLKEVSYIHSEAYQAGELKHGTISLISKDMPVFAIVTDFDIREKTISNIEEVKSRGANIIVITNEKIPGYDLEIVVPNVSDFIQPLLVVPCLQLIAYEVAKLRGCDIDKPKNLAKSVTVE